MFLCSLLSTEMAFAENIQYLKYLYNLSKNFANFFQNNFSWLIIFIKFFHDSIFLHHDHKLKQITRQIINFTQKCIQKFFFYQSEKQYKEDQPLQREYIHYILNSLISKILNQFF